MRFKLKLLIMGAICLYIWTWASADTQANLPAASQKIRNESQALAGYSGIVGTSPGHDTISNAGGAFEFLPNGTNIYGFFSQTLANDIYYEARLYGRYNYVTANPNIPGLPPSNITPPLGYGITGILGYNFHPSDVVDITPYARINVQSDMGPVYSDSNGNHIDSITYALLAGSKLAFKATPMFSPYVNIWGGYQWNNLSGTYPNAVTNTNTPINGQLGQIAITYEIGLGAKLSEHITLIPYWQYITNINQPDGAASTAIDQGGLNQGNLTGTAQVFALKLNIAW
ncbi:MAG: hypothetical protein K0R14_2035 [Burkholderiales bacterium]|jgi:hypothetical protein|nr:hypothetical protein [Burkholderiales bacterium]